MRTLIKELESALGRNCIPHNLEEKAKNLLNELYEQLPLFVRAPTQTELNKCSLLRYEMVLNFVFGEFFYIQRTSKKEYPDYDYNNQDTLHDLARKAEYFYSDDEFRSFKTPCDGCKFQKIEIRSKSEYYGGWACSYCQSPFPRCSKQVYTWQLVRNTLIKWLIVHSDILERATKDCTRELTYISQNISERKKGYCGALYKTIQGLIIEELIKHKTFNTLCNSIQTC